jgi:hypothetical protein
MYFRLLISYNLLIILYIGNTSYNYFYAEQLNFGDIDALHSGDYFYKALSKKI